MATVRILSNMVALPGGVTRRKGDTFDGPDELCEKMVRVRAAEWVEGGPAKADEPETAPEPPAFASASAEKLAAAEGLAAEDFAGVEPSGKTGYTKADVESVVEGK